MTHNPQAPRPNELNGRATPLGLVALEMGAPVSLMVRLAENGVIGAERASDGGWMLPRAEVLEIQHWLPDALRLGVKQDAASMAMARRSLLDLRQRLLADADREIRRGIRTASGNRRGRVDK